MTGHSSLSAGVYVALAFGSISALLIAFAILATVMWWRGREEYRKLNYLDRPVIPPGFFALIPWFFGVLGAVIVALTMYPYSSQYHHWTVTSGEVTSVNSRIVGAGDRSVNQRFVVNLKGIGYRSCDDTRCASVKVGDLLTITCKRAWQYSGTDGWDCNWVNVKAGDRT